MTCTMSHVNLFDAKSNLSQLVERALAGEDVVIAKRGAPLVRLVPVGITRRVPGSARGAVKLTDDFDIPLADFAEYR
jgi:prevent-host-death family protein